VTQTDNEEHQGKKKPERKGEIERGKGKQKGKIMDYKFSFYLLYLSNRALFRVYIASSKHEKG